MMRKKLAYDEIRTIYFVEAVGMDAVKVGYSTISIPRRMAHLQSGSVSELKLLGTVPGSLRHESALHHRFQDQHLRGEWFRLSGIRDQIAAILETQNVGLDFKAQKKKSTKVSKVRFGESWANLKFIHHDGKTLSFDTWARERGLLYTELYDRIHKNGWSIDRALAMPGATRPENSPISQALVDIRKQLAERRWMARAKPKPMDAEQLTAAIVNVMHRVPELNNFGIVTKKDELFEKNRELLRQSVERVAATIDWLQKNVRPIQSINRKHDSYGLKHRAEKSVGYITNGVFVVAAIIAGYRYEIRLDSPNVVFGMSEISIGRL